MSDDVVYTSKENGALFVQLDGPGTKPAFLQCHDVDDFDIDQGSINTLLQCFDVDGNWRTLGFTRNAPGLIDINLGTYVGKAADALETADCPFALFMLLRCGGKADLITNYDRLWVVQVANIGTHGLAGIIRREEDVAAMQTFGAQAYPEVIPWFKLEGARQTTSEEKGLNDIAFCNAERCQGRCGTAQDICQDGAIVGDSEAAGSPSAMGIVLETADGNTWTGTVADPFIAGEDISAVECFASPTGADVIRKLVARGTTDGANPAEIAWTEDDGATWTNVDVGAVTGEYVVNDIAVFALDFYNIWLGTDGGYIYYSDDGGATWTIQDAGVLTANAYHSIHFSSDLNGFAGSTAGFIAETTDGGSTWSAATTAGSAIVEGLWAFDSQVIIAVESDSTMYKTTDGATTWSQITTFPLSTGSLDDIEFVNDYIGAVVHNTAAPIGTVYVTFDGGYTWELATGVTNSGLNAIFFCGTDKLYAVGERNGGTAVIVKYSPVS
jgi:photosystem II stability/assembly factor-like uncharacterized protein